MSEPREYTDEELVVVDRLPVDANGRKFVPGVDIVWTLFRDTKGELIPTTNVMTTHDTMGICKRLSFNVRGWFGNIHCAPHEVYLVKQEAEIAARVQWAQKQGLDLSSEATDAST